jgi:serine phosphatase RsbU (regulator of sigma subunit)/ligand-binding sensor domain-containing protein
MQRLGSLLLTIFTVSSFVSYGQRENLPVVNYTSREFGKEYNPEVYCTVQDGRGVMYFGTANGIHEFDGTRWKYIKVQAGSFVRSLAVDSSGTVFVGTYGEFGFLAPNEFGDLEFSSLLSKVPEDDQYFSNIWDVHCSSSKVYFQAQEQVMEYDLKTEKMAVIYPLETSSFHTSFLIDGILYLRAREIGIQKYVNGSLERLNGTEFVRELGVFGLHKLKDDSLLIITQEIGLWKWKNGAARLLPQENDFDLAALGIFGSRQLSDGNFALWTFSSGVYVMNDAGKIIKHFDQQSGLQTNDVKHLFEDRDQNIWLSMENGVAQINYFAPFSYYGKKAGINGNVAAMIRFKDKLFVGTSDGLYIQSSNADRIFENSNQISGTVGDFCQVGDQLYIATANGVLVTSDGINLRAVTPRGVDANAINYVPNKGMFVLSGPKGIYIYNKNFSLIYEMSDNLSVTLGIENDPLYEDRVWIGTVSNGAYKLTIADSIQLEQYTDFDGLLDNMGKPLFFHDDLVFGCKQGLSYFMDEEEMKIGLTPEELSDPLNYRGMFQVQEFHEFTTDGQFLYLASANGRDWFSDDNFSIAYYDHKKDEFIRRPFKGIDIGRINEFYLEDDGTLWIGGSDGLIGYTGNEKDSYKTHYYSLIRKLTIGEDSLIFDGSFQTNGVIQARQSEEFEIDIDYEFNDVKFEFSSPYFEYLDAIEYSYILEGYNESWSRWSKKTEANFTNLNEGDYNFKVKARNVYKVESEVAEFKFSISPPWYRTAWAILLYVVGFVLVFFIGFRLFSLRLKKKNLWLEGVVEERTSEIREKNQVLAHQKQEIEDSINYAQRIQEALLPLEDEMKRWLPNSFVLFKPKDIVSGDFYWFSEKDGKLVFVCADCTGHGVPGAFMSMIGSDRLNIIVQEREVTDPGEILSELNKAIKKSLKQDGQSGSTKDGMDAAICTLDLKSNELSYAGANRPLWIIQNGELEEIKATKVAVAGFTPDSQVFEKHILKLKPGMKFYMTTDGYADQFGGVRGKKLKVKSLKEFIIGSSAHEFEEQKSELDTYLMDWMKGYEQIDDVCVIGFEPAQ